MNRLDRLSGSPACSSLVAVVLATALGVLIAAPAHGHVCGDSQFDGTDPNVETCDATASPSFLPGAPSSHGPCRLPGDPCGQCHFCGDNLVQSCEQCDDGNDIDNDGCANDCTIPTTTTTINTSTTTSSSTSTTTTTSTSPPTTDPITTTTSSTTTTEPTTTTTSSTTTTEPPTTSTSTTTASSTTTTTTLGCVPVPEDCSNMIDDDCDGLVDCAEDQGPDPDCQPCPIAKKDPTDIRFLSGPDRLRSKAVLEMPQVDLDTLDVGVLLSNPNQVLYKHELHPGDLTKNSKGTIFRFTDVGARTAPGGGLYSLKIKAHRDGNGYSISTVSYADLSAAEPLDQVETLKHMRVQFYIGDVVFITIDTSWTRTPSGWRAPKDH